ncbi:MAG: autotransporter-associated beta strand repeat-containing protein [Opitutaceae bacterium]|nr:autotransporter-associated beta strand repeat-containing protein [Opitutaceae bacterium]
MHPLKKSPRRARFCKAAASNHHRARVTGAALVSLTLLCALPAADITWVGGVSGTWNTSAANWSGASTVFTNLDNVSFTDSGLTPNPTIGVTTNPLNVGTMAVSNTSGTYTVNATSGGTLTGATLTKSGAGTLTFGQTGAIAFTNTNLQGGTLIIRQNAFTGGAINVSGNVEVGSVTAATTTLAGTTLTGSGELTFTPNGGTRMSLNADTSGFTGTLKASASGQVNMVAASSYTLSQAKVVLSGDTLFQGLAAGTLQIGEITTGSANRLGYGITNASALVYQIGALNTASSIAGVIQNGGTTITNGAATGTVGLTKVGTGSLSLTGANTYTAATTVNAGTLLVGNGTSGSIASALTVNAGAFYGNLASGNVTTAAVTIGNGAGSADSSFGAGQNVIGRFASSSSLTLGTDARFVFDLNSFTETTDTVTFGGTVTLNGLFALNDLNTGAINWSLNDSFTVLSGSSITSTFANLADGGTIIVNGVTYLADYTGTSVTLTVTDISPIPEPATFATLLSMSSFALVLFARRRRA